MKKVIYVSLMALLIAACNKTSNNTPVTPAPVTTNPTPDNTPPVITLNGATNDTMSLNSAYTDPGATAADNIDGNITSSVVVSGTLNKDLKGEYRLYYNVKDAAGNAAAQITRYVYVKNDADDMIGAYHMVPNCGATPTSPFTTTLSTSTTQNYHVFFGVPENFTGIVPEVTIAGSNMSIAPLNANGSSINGNGTLAADKKSFSLNFVSTSPIDGTVTCSAAYTKQ